jgi:hypothetical protein
MALLEAFYEQKKCQFRNLEAPVFSGGPEGGAATRLGAIALHQCFSTGVLRRTSVPLNFCLVCLKILNCCEK